MLEMPLNLVVIKPSSLLTALLTAFPTSYYTIKPVRDIVNQPDLTRYNMIKVEEYLLLTRDLVTVPFWTMKFQAWYRQVDSSFSLVSLRSQSRERTILYLKYKDIRMKVTVKVKGEAKLANVKALVTLEYIKGMKETKGGIKHKIRCSKILESFTN